MVSRRRHFEVGYVYHVLNRAGLRQQLFSSNQDYIDFETLVAATHRQYPLPILTYELMPNHWHFVVRPHDKEQLSCFFQYLAGTHAKRFRAALRSVGQGHVYQDRFKSFPVQDDGHLLVLCRYVERNALRAGLVARAEDWRWSGLYRRLSGTDDWLDSDWPVQRPSHWLDLVNDPLTDQELEAVRQCVVRGRPFGSDEWTCKTADRHGLQWSLRPRGRPSIVRP